MRRELTYTLDGIDGAAQAVLDAVAESEASVVAFRGEMGAGKTTLIGAICRRLGCRQQASSPTFAIINQYVAADGEVISHFDFYRIERVEEAFDLGYEEYFYGGGLCLVEWPEKIEGLLPGKRMEVGIGIAGPRDRTLKIAVSDDKG